MVPFAIVYCNCFPSIVGLPQREAGFAEIVLGMYANII